MAKFKISIPDELAEQLTAQLGKTPIEHAVAELVKLHAAGIGAGHKTIVLTTEHIAELEKILGETSLGAADDVVRRTKERCQLKLSGIECNLPNGWLARVEEYARRNNQDPKFVVEQAVKKLVAHLFGYW